MLSRNHLGSKSCNLLGCYGTPYLREKLEFWERLQEIVQNLEGPWLLFGDLNEVSLELEKFRGQNIWARQLHLKNFIQQVGGVDLGFSGAKYA